MAGVIDGFRWALLGGEKPSFGLLSGLVRCMSMVLLLSGFIYFKRVEETFADLV